MRKTIVIGLIIQQLAANANPLQVMELKEDIRRLEISTNEAKLALRAARDSYNSLDTALNHQRHAYKLLIQAERDKTLAESRSLKNIGIRPFYADPVNISGSVRLVNQNLGGS